MSFADYTALKTALDALFQRADVTTSDFMDPATYMAERRMYDLLRVPEMITIDESFAHTARYTDLPTGFLEMDNVIGTFNGKRRELEAWTKGQVSAYESEGVGSAHGYTIVGKKIELIPSVDATLELVYYGTFDSLVSGTNDIHTTYPDVYLYGVATELAISRQDEKRLSIYDARFKAALKDANDAAKRLKIGRGARARRM